MSYIADKLLLRWINAADGPGSLFFSTKQVGGQMHECQNCGRPGHPVPMHVGGIGYVTMQLCGLPDCWQAADKKVSRERQLPARNAKE